MTRRLLSAFFLAIFLFNVVGYYGIFWVARTQANRQMINRIDSEDYNREELITLEIPLSLPYPIQSEDFSRINGSFEHQGEFYKLVEQKVEDGTLYLVCIKDHKEKELHTAMSDFAKVSNDVPATSKTMKVLSSFAKDFERTGSFMMESTAGWCSVICTDFISVELLSGHFSVLSPPPWNFV